MLFSCSVMSNSLWPHGLQHARLPCPSLSPRVLKLSSIESKCHPIISFSLVPFSYYPQSFSIRAFSSELALHIGWPKYWSFNFNISPSNEYSGFISFRIDWFDLLAVQGTLKHPSSTTVQKNQFFSTQPSSWSSFHIRTWLLEKTLLWLDGTMSAKNISAF